MRSYQVPNYNGHFKPRQKVKAAFMFTDCLCFGFSRVVTQREFDLICSQMHFYLLCVVRFTYNLDLRLQEEVPCGKSPSLCPLPSR